MTRSSRGRASTRGGSAGVRSSTRRRGSSPSGGNQTMVIGGVVAAIVVVVVVIVMASRPSGGSGAGETPAQPGKTPAAAPSQPQPSAARPNLAGSARGGKTPDRPAPAIDPADLQRAEDHYDAGVAKWNESQAARTKGDTAAYAAALDAAFDELVKQRDAMREYTDWFEEADLEGWAMPAEYDGLQRKLNLWDPTYQKVKKLKQVH